MKRVRFAANWGRENPDTAWQWATQLGDGERAVVQANLLRDLARRDGPSAVQKLEEMTPGEGRNRAIEYAVHSWASRDPTAAAAYVESLADPERRKQAMDSLPRAAVPEIGVSLSVGEDGYPTVTGDCQLAGKPAGCASRE